LTGSFTTSAALTIDVVTLLLADKRSAETKRAYAADIRRFFAATFATETPPTPCASSPRSPCMRSPCVSHTTSRAWSRRTGAGRSRVRRCRSTATRGASGRGSAAAGGRARHGHPARTARRRPVACYGGVGFKESGSLPPERRGLR
jgi:hypothetical protein